MIRLAAALLFLQVSSLGADTPTPEPQHFRYTRSVFVPQDVSGQACAVLDGLVFAHAAKPSADDLRLYDNTGAEQPFFITESGSTRFGDESADVRNVHAHNGVIEFDLAMPGRPYTAVYLNLDAKNFVADARVTGSNSGEAPVQLGDFVLFDFSSQHLARSTALPLQESAYQTLHVALHITSTIAARTKAFPISIVKGAIIPPSREAQTLYTTIATASNFTARGRESIATIHIPAHVPVERFEFVLKPAAGDDFERQVSITAKPDAAQDTAFVESIPGQISRTHLPSSIASHVLNGNPSQLSVDGVLGANLRKNAMVDIAVANGSNPPLPLRAVQLQMRERRICFRLSRAASPFTLRYGDEALKPPVYNDASTSVANELPTVVATLGPERKNVNFRARNDTRPYSQRHPATLWFALIAAIAALGVLGMRGSRKRA